MHWLGNGRIYSAHSARPHQLFQSHSWLQHWCRHYHQRGSNGGQRLAIVIARQHGRLCLILPLLVVQNAGVKILHWMGLPASQYGDAIISDLALQSDLTVAAINFAVRETRADMLWLRKVRDDAAISPVLQKIGADVVCESSAPFIDLSSYSNADDYMRRFSSNARKQRRRRRRRLEELGKVTFTWHRAGQSAAAAAVDAMRLKRAALGKAARLTAVDDCLEKFFVGFCSEARGPVEPVVSELALDGEAIAYEIGLIHDGHYVAHLGTFDPRFAQHGPGTLQIDETIAACMEQGIQTYDLLAPADDYKLSFADDSICVRDYALAVSPLGRLYKRLDC